MNSQAPMAKMLVLGTVAGGLLGLGVAYLMMQRAERSGGRVSVSAGEFLRLSVLTLGLMREVAMLPSGEPED
jgi:nitrate reductase gamma subunit